MQEIPLDALYAVLLAFKTGEDVAFVDYAGRACRAEASGFLSVDGEVLGRPLRVDQVLRLILHSRFDPQALCLSPSMGLLNAVAPHFSEHLVLVCRILLRLGKFGTWKMIAESLPSEWPRILLNYFITGHKNHHKKAKKVLKCARRLLNPHHVPSRDLLTISHILADAISMQLKVFVQKAPSKRLTTFVKLAESISRKSTSVITDVFKPVLFKVLNEILPKPKLAPAGLLLHSLVLGGFLAPSIQSKLTSDALGGLECLIAKSLDASLIHAGMTFTVKHAIQFGHSFDNAFAKALNRFGGQEWAVGLFEKSILQAGTFNPFERLARSALQMLPRIGKESLNSLGLWITPNTNPHIVRFLFLAGVSADYAPHIAIALDSTKCHRHLQRLLLCDHRHCDVGRWMPIDELDADSSYLCFIPFPGESAHLDWWFELMRWRLRFFAHRDIPEYFKALQQMLKWPSSKWPISFKCPYVLEDLLAFSGKGFDPADLMPCIGLALRNGPLPAGLSLIRFVQEFGWAYWYTPPRTNSSIASQMEITILMLVTGQHPSQSLEIAALHRRSFARYEELLDAMMESDHSGYHRRRHFRMALSRMLPFSGHVSPVHDSDFSPETAKWALLELEMQDREEQLERYMHQIVCAAQACKVAPLTVISSFQGNSKSLYKRSRPWKKFFQQLVLSWDITGANDFTSAGDDPGGFIRSVLLELLWERRHSNNSGA